MKFIATGFPGLFVVEPQVFEDERGFFMESYSRAAFEARGLDAEFIQDNHARSEQRGVLRGLHFQMPRHRNGDAAIMCSPRTRCGASSF